MFNDDKNIATAQKVMLEILMEIHKICVDNNITYWLEAGTLLGAVRHRGFIPWDDDCDVSMPRKDYEKFLLIAQNKLPEDMFLQTKETDSEYPLSWAKIRKSGTLLIEKGESGKENYHHGIFVDIFPYDNYKSADIIKKLQWARRTKDEKNKYPKGSLERFFYGLYANVLLYIPIHNIESKRKNLIKNRDKYNNMGYEFFTYSAEVGDACLTTVDDILTVKLIEAVFENQSFYIPNNYDKVLRAAYGENYMELPPINQRKTHAKYIKNKNI